jgi:hypothetical protein
LDSEEKKGENKMGQLRIPLCVAFTMVLLLGCASVQSPSKAELSGHARRMFIGTWEGSHVDQEGNLLRTWRQRRYADGTYAMTFVHYTKEGIRRSTQKGTWWVEGDRFYEIAPDTMEDPDAYRFEILNENEIRFESLTTDYEFIDRRTQDQQDVTFT